MRTFMVHDCRSLKLCKNCWKKGIMLEHSLTPINHELSVSVFTKIIRVISEIRADLCGKMAKIIIAGLNFYKNSKALIFISFLNKNSMSQYLK